MQEPEIFRGSNRTRRRWNHSLNCAPNSTSLVSKLPTRHLGSHSRITASREDHRHQHCLTNISHNKRLLQYPFQYRQPSHIHACTNPVPKQRASDQIPPSAKHQTKTGEILALRPQRPHPRLQIHHLLHPRRPTPPHHPPPSIHRPRARLLPLTT